MQFPGMQNIPGLDPSVQRILSDLPNMLSGLPGMNNMPGGLFNIGPNI